MAGLYILTILTKRQHCGVTKMADRIKPPLTLNKGGRPTKYTKALLATGWDYLQNFQDYGDEVPSHVALFLELGISKTQAYDWAKEPKKAEISDMLASCKQIQERILLSGGLSSRYNSNIVKLMLTKHGYTDKAEVETTVNAPQLNINLTNK